HGCGGRRIRVDHHQQVELVHGALHFEAARLRVGRVPPVEHRAQVGGLVDDVGVLEHAIDPARYGDARLGHQVGRGVPALDPFVVDAPRVGEVLPRTFGQAIVARQGVRVGPHVGGALHVVVAAEDVGATAGTADVAQRQL